MVLVLGLLTRPLARVLPPVFTANLGDALYAVFAYLLLALAFPRASPFRAFAFATLFCAAVECSQLYRAPWLSAIRLTTLGGLVLGSGFAWGDLACYVAGTGFCLLAETRQRRPSATG